MARIAQSGNETGSLLGLGLLLWHGFLDHLLKGHSNAKHPVKGACDLQRLFFLGHGSKVAHLLISAL